MTQVWQGFGEAPVPSLMSSYWRPLGVFCILDSPFCAASCADVGLTSSATAGAVASATANAAAESRAKRFFIVFFLSRPRKGRGSLSQENERKTADRGPWF